MAGILTMCKIKKQIVWDLGDHELCQINKNHAGMCNLVTIKKGSR